jgi:transcriptional antiterminator NusG
MKKNKKKNPNQVVCLANYSGHEQNVKVTIESEIKRLQLQERIKEIIIPQETVFEVRQASAKQESRTSFRIQPHKIVVGQKDQGYSFEPAVCGKFFRNKDEPPRISRTKLKRSLAVVEVAPFDRDNRESYSIGDPVKFIDGPFTSFNGLSRK